MTNTIAAILVLIVTNWVNVGTFTDHDNKSFDVLEGRTATNTEAVVNWNGKEFRLLMQSDAGPTNQVRQFKERPPVWIWATNYCVTNWGAIRY